MRKKWLAFLDGYGYYALVCLCLVVVISAAVWTRRDDASRALSTPSAADQAEKLSDVQFASTTQVPETPALISPLEEALVIRTYSDAPVYWSGCRLWRVHQAVDYSASKGDIVRAMKAGKVVALDSNQVTIRHLDGTTALYAGLCDLCVALDDTVAQGETLGAAAGFYAGEGENLVHVAVYDESGAAINFLEE